MAFLFQFKLIEGRFTLEKEEARGIQLYYKKGWFRPVSIFFVQLVLSLAIILIRSIFLKAKHDELIHESITLHNHELILR